MPPQPRWYAALPQIRRKLEAMPDTIPLDRKAIEQLFNVKARQANYLMAQFAGYAVGQSTALSRSALLASIDEMTRPNGVAVAEIQRKVTARTFLNKLQQTVRPKKIPRPPPPPVGAPLPAGVRLIAPGEIAISFTTPEELLSRNLALSRSAISDFASFAAGLEYPAPRTGVCTAGDIGQSVPAPDPDSPTSPASGEGPTS